MKIPQANLLAAANSSCFWSFSSLRSCHDGTTVCLFMLQSLGTIQCWFSSGTYIPRPGLWFFLSDIFQTIDPSSSVPASLSLASQFRPQALTDCVWSKQTWNKWTIRMLWGWHGPSLSSASPRFSPIWSFNNRIWAWSSSAIREYVPSSHIVQEVQSVSSKKSVLLEHFQYQPVFRTINRIWPALRRIWVCLERVSQKLRCRMQVPLLPLNPFPAVALHQNGLVWSCITFISVEDSNAKMYSQCWGQHQE